MVCQLRRVPITSRSWFSIVEGTLSTPKWQELDWPSPNLSLVEVVSLNALGSPISAKMWRLRASLNALVNEYADDRREIASDVRHRCKYSGLREAINELKGWQEIIERSRRKILIALDAKRYIDQAFDRHQAKTKHTIEEEIVAAQRAIFGLLATGKIECRARRPGELSWETVPSDHFNHPVQLRLDLNTLEPGPSATRDIAALINAEMPCWEDLQVRTVDIRHLLDPNLGLVDPQTSSSSSRTRSKPTKIGLAIEWIRKTYPNGLPALKMTILVEQFRKESGLDYVSIKTLARAVKQLTESSAGR